MKIFSRPLIRMMLMRSLSFRLTLLLIALVTLMSTTTLQTLAAEADKTNFTLIIDAGHGGHDHGAIDNGAREKDINLGVATKLAALIKKKLKNVKVVMTRDKDYFVSLQERANIANRNKGNLFLSIHTNSVDKNNPNRTKISGASVYALGGNKSNDNLRVARRENSVIELEKDYNRKYSGFDPSKDESYIIFEMAQKKTIGQSLRFAEKAQRALVSSGRNDRGVRQAGFWVLWATAMPSVLVELDFICNPQAAAYLNSERGQEVLADALFTAVKQYVENHNKSVAETDQGIYQPDNNGSVEPKLGKDYTASYMNETEDLAIADTKSETVGMLVSSNSEKKARTRTAPPSSATRTTGGPRRRRSQAAREASDSRNLETVSIEQKSETSYLLQSEKTETKVIQEQPVEDDTKGKKGKKKKDKKKKTPKPKNDNKSNKDKNTGRGNQKTFVVKGSQPNAQKSQPETKSGSGTDIQSKVLSRGSKTTELHRVYKILLATSDREIPAQDSRFRGYEPTGMFVENGLYKYTYGGSESRREIENQLINIKNVLPEASIIVRME